MKPVMVILHFKKSRKNKILHGKLSCLLHILFPLFSYINISKYVAIFDKHC